MLNYVIKKTKRSSALKRIQFLDSNKDKGDIYLDREEVFLDFEYIPKSSNSLEDIIFKSNLKLTKFSFIFIVLLTAIIIGVLSSFFFSVYYSPIFFLIGGSLPVFYLFSKVDKRAMEFSKDYPSVLLATATSIKAGMTPLVALERAIKLLPSSSFCKEETIKLMKALDSGVDKKKAISQYGVSVDLPEISLFRTAFLLVMEHGGPFIPTLERLAEVTRERMNLISSSKVSTASMKMTANVLLSIIPIVLVFLSVGNKDYWNIISENPLANSVATFGVILIILGYIILRRMSVFKP